MFQTNFKNSFIKSFYDKFSSFSDTENFLFIGKPSAWDDDNSPPEITNTFSEDLDARKNILAYKKILPQEVVFVVKRVDWEHGTVYDKYDHTIDLYSETTPTSFYVLTTDKNVYKCISNNDGAISEYSPTGTSTDSIVTQDGYVWKYMYSVRPELEDFITQDFIPIDFIDELFYDDNRTLQLSVEQDAKLNKSGEIAHIEVVQRGASYPFAIDYDIPDTNLEESHIVQAAVSIGSTSIKLNIAAGASQVDNFYNNNYVVYIAQGTGSGQVRTIVDYDGSTGIAIVDSAFTSTISTSSFYKILPRVEIFGNGVGAVAVVNLNKVSKLIESVSVLNGGTGYTEASAFIKTSKTASADKTTTKVIISPMSGHGSSVFEELGCKNLIIKSTFTAAEKLKLDFVNEYRQIGVIQNPKMVGLPATRTQKYGFDIESINATSTIRFVSPIVGTLLYTLLLDVKANGNIIKQGSDNNLGQARGTIKTLPNSPIPSGPDDYMVLQTVNGKFLKYPESTTYPLVIEDYPTIGTDTLLSQYNLKEVGPSDYFTDTTFVPNQVILGKTSKSTAIVNSWTPTFFGTDGKLVVSDMKGVFDESYYDDSGTLINGEIIVGFEGINSSNEIIGNTADRVAIIKNVSKLDIIEGDSVFQGVTVFTCTESSGDNWVSKFTGGTFVKQGTTNATGLVVGSYVDPQNPSQLKLMISNIVGSFSVAGSSAYSLAISETGEYYQNLAGVTNPIIIDINTSEAEEYTGKLIYLENIRPVVRSNDQDEQIKLIIGF